WPSCAVSSKNTAATSGWTTSVNPVVHACDCDCRRQFVMHRRSRTERGRQPTENSTGIHGARQYSDVHRYWSVNMRNTHAAALVLLLSGQALAFTPESGFWWNPNESGRG